MKTTVSTTHKNGRKTVEHFFYVFQAAKHAERVAKNAGPEIVSILMQGPDGEREFIT